MGPARLPKLDALTSLRFFAAAMLVVFHTDLLLFTGKIGHAVALSQGVSFFFVLSGFILFYNYPKLENAAKVQRFLVARFARIWPALAIVTLFVVCQLPFNHRAIASGKHLVWIILSELTMVQSWIPHWKYFLGLNPPTWSISTEFGFYLAFPFLLMNWQKTWHWKLSLVASMTIACISIGCWLGGQPQTESVKNLEQWIVYVSPLVRLLEFVVGMTVAFVYLKVRPLLSTTNRTHTLLLSAAQWLALAFVALAMVVCGSCETGLPIVATLWVRTSGGFLAFAFLIFTMAFSEGQLAKLLRVPAMVFLGEVSYSIYLLHVAFLFYVQDQIASKLIHLNNPGQICTVLLLFTAALIGTSTLIYFLVEKPWRRGIIATFDRIADRAKIRSAAVEVRSARLDGIPSLLEEERPLSSSSQRID